MDQETGRPGDQEQRATTGACLLEMKSGGLSQGRVAGRLGKVDLLVSLRAPPCSLSLWRVARGSKHMFLELIHGLFIT
jgi:hypothetical protein